MNPADRTGRIPCTRLFPCRRRYPWKRRYGMGLRRLTSPKQRRLDEHLELQGEGRIGARERRELQDLVEEAESFTMANARMLARARTAANS